MAAVNNDRRASQSLAVFTNLQDVDEIWELQSVLFRGHVSSYGTVTILFAVSKLN